MSNQIMTGIGPRDFLRVPIKDMQWEIQKCPENSNWVFLKKIQEKISILVILEEGIAGINYGKENSEWGVFFNKDGNEWITRAMDMCYLGDNYVVDEHMKNNRALVCEAIPYLSCRFN